MDCPKCGTHNLDDAERCRLCGAPLRLRAASYSGPTKNCAFCGTINELEAPFCTGCGRPMGSTYSKTVEKKEKKTKYYDRTYADYPASAARTARVGVGGVLIIMGAFFALVDAVFTTIIFYQATLLPEYGHMLRENPDLQGVVSSMIVCQGLRLIFVVIAFAGGIFAVQRLRWGLSITGGVMCILGLGSGIMLLVIPFWGLIELLLLVCVLIGVVMIGISRKEFLLS